MAVPLFPSGKHEANLREWRALSLWLIISSITLYYIMTMALAGSTTSVSPTVTETLELTYMTDGVPIELVLPTQIEETNSDLSPEPTKYEEPFSDQVLCNCYRFVDSVVDLPHSSVVRNNLEDSGNVAVFYYPESGLFHYAFVVNRDGDSVMIAETNYHRCQYSQRVIRTDYPNLIGFFQA